MNKILLTKRETSHIKKAVFLDRDGVVNYKMADHDYVKKVSELRINPSFYKLLRMTDNKEWLLVVVTNQRGIAKGMLTHEDLKNISYEMNNKLLSKGYAGVDCVYYCPHDIDDKQCVCRKPKPGMLLQSISDFSLTDVDCIMVGDADSDIFAAKAAGIVKTIKVDSNRPEQALSKLLQYLS